MGELKRREEEQQQDKADLHYSLDERCRLQEVEVEHSRLQQEVRFNLIVGGTSKPVARKALAQRYK